MKKFPKILFSLFLFFVGITVFASNFTFLTDAPVSHFTNKDWDAFNRAKDKAVEAKDGVKISWSNPDSGAWGYLIPYHTRKENGLTCRSLKIVNNAKERPGEATYKICKMPDGWKAF